MASGPARVLITTEEAEPLGSLLRCRGLQPIHLPLVQARALTGSPPCERPGTVLLSSARALDAAPDLPRWAAGAAVLCVGAATAEAARRVGLRPDRVGESGGAALLDELDGFPEPWVFVGAQSPAPPMRAAIASGRVLAWTVYALHEAASVAPPPADLVLLGSPSAVRAWSRTGDHTVPVAVLGETTEAAATVAGLRVVVRPARPSWAELVEAAAVWLARNENGLVSEDTSP